MLQLGITMMSSILLHKALPLKVFVQPWWPWGQCFGWSSGLQAPEMKVTPQGAKQDKASICHITDSGHWASNSSCLPPCIPSQSCKSLGPTASKGKDPLKDYPRMQPKELNSKVLQSLPLVHRAYRYVHSFTFGSYSLSKKAHIPLQASSSSTSASHIHWLKWGNTLVSLLATKSRSYRKAASLPAGPTDHLIWGGALPRSLHT